MRRLVPLVCALALAACGGGEQAEPTGDEGTPPAAQESLEGVPPELAALRRQAGRLLDGGDEAFERRLRELRGHPVVVNKWASWCPPCRAEFPFFRSQAEKRAREVAFLGVDSNDNDADAREFLRKLPVPFPSYKDPKLEVAAKLKAVQAFPATAFYDRRGELAFVKQGGYSSERKLAEDIERYAR